MQKALTSIVLACSIGILAACNPDNDTKNTQQSSNTTSKQQAQFIKDFNNQAKLDGFDGLTLKKNQCIFDDKLNNNTTKTIETCDYFVYDNKTLVDDLTTSVYTNKNLNDQKSYFINWGKKEPSDNKNKADNKSKAYQNVATTLFGVINPKISIDRRIATAADSLRITINKKQEKYALPDMLITVGPKGDTDSVGIFIAPEAKQ